MCVSPQVHMLKPQPPHHVTLSGDGNSKVVIKVTWDHKGEALVPQDCCCKMKCQWASLLSPGAKWGHEQGSHPQARKKPSPETDSAAPWSRTPSFQNCGNINFYCLSPPFCFIMAAWAAYSTRSLLFCIVNPLISSMENVNTLPWKCSWARERKDQMICERIS